MGRSDYYREQAERCTRLANSGDPETRERLLELANKNALMARGLAARQQKSANDLEIPDDWTPTTDNINALPDALRKYIHDLDTFMDLAGIVRQNLILKPEKLRS